jgi:hypothetical protein
MFNETDGNSHAGHRVTSRQYLLSLFCVLLFALTIIPSKVDAQILNNFEVQVPFQFHVGNTKLPAGQYRIHVLDDSDLSVMEIMSTDGSISALFQVQETEANSTPAKSELLFNKYGNRYFLAKLFEEGSASGSQVIESRYEKTVSHQTMEAQEHVPAHRRAQQGN